MDEATLAQWLIDNGCAEEKRGYGHICGEDLAEKLLEHFHITKRDTDDN